MKLTPLQVFLTTFCASSLAGLAAALRSGHPLTWRAVASAMLNSGCLGLGIALVWYEKFSIHPDGLWFLMGVSLLAGLGGTTVVDFVLEALKSYLVRLSDRPGE